MNRRMCVVCSSIYKLETTGQSEKYCSTECSNHKNNSAYYKPFTIPIEGEYKAVTSDLIYFRDKDANNN